MVDLLLPRDGLSMECAATLGDAGFAFPERSSVFLVAGPAITRAERSAKRLKTLLTVENNLSLVPHRPLVKAFPWVATCVSLQLPFQAARLIEERSRYGVSTNLNGLALKPMALRFYSVYKSVYYASTELELAPRVRQSLASMLSCSLRIPRC